MQKTMSGIAAAVAALMVAGSASAQVCAGFPTNDGQGTIGALATFPSDFDQYGVEGSYNLTGPLAVNAGYIYSKGHDDDSVDEEDDNLNTFRGGLALDLSTFVGNLLPGISLCPNVRADYTTEDGVTLWQVPIGLGFGASLPVGGPDMTLTPYVIPALVWTRADIGGGIDDSETNFGIRGGADLSFDRFYLGGTVEWVDAPHPFNGQTKAIFGVRAGFKF
ncbi:MAG TPA: hypothetical protein VM890_00270 [Longimicrobium sp.]|jgi:hypothetical protein|nr:hypothetical protein [Longimicrobium sp.]